MNSPAARIFVIIPDNITTTKNIDRPT